jgi:hypothetical protein
MPENPYQPPKKQRSLPVSPRDTMEGMSRPDLIDVRMADGSRHFAEVAWRPPQEFKQLVEASGATVTEVIEHVTENWIDFTYAGESFTAHNSWNDYWLFVRNPDCPELVLHDVVRLAVVAFPSRRAVR